MTTLLLPKRIIYCLFLYQDFKRIINLNILKVEDLCQVLSESISSSSIRKYLDVFNCVSCTEPLSQRSSRAPSPVQNYDDMEGQFVGSPPPQPQGIRGPIHKRYFKFYLKIILTFL